MASDGPYDGPLRRTQQAGRQAGAREMREARQIDPCVYGVLLREDGPGCHTDRQTRTRTDTDTDERTTNHTDGSKVHCPAVLDLPVMVRADGVVSTSKQDLLWHNSL